MAERSIDIARPVLGDDEWEALREPIMSGWVTHGPNVKAFESSFAKFHHVNHALAVSSCTTGLHLALKAIGVAENDEVIVPSFTWIATANAVLYCGATPVFADVQRDTFNIDPDSVLKKLSSRTRAVVAVHLFGLCGDISALRMMIPNHVHIIEDAACAAGASIYGRMAGGLGDVAVFSFHPRKIITTGEGGMVTTNNAELAGKVDVMRNHGASISEEQRHSGSQPYLLPEFNELGYNYRMTDLQGAIGQVQLTKLGGFIAERRRWASFYEQELHGIDWLALPACPRDYGHSWQSFVCIVDPVRAPLPRNQIMKLLLRRGIHTRPGTHAVHMLGYYSKRYGIHPDEVPESRYCYENSLALPLHNRMDADDYAYVIDVMKGL